MRLALALLFAFTIEAQPIEYRVNFGSSSMNVYAHDGKVRADSEEPGLMFDTLLWRGGDITALNSTRQTYFRLDSQPFSLRSYFFAPPMAERVRKVRWAFDEKPGRYKGTLSYIARGPADVRIEAEFDITTDVNRDRRNWLGRILPVSVYKEVEDLLAASDAKIIGIPTEMTLQVKRTYEGGPTMTDSSRISTSDFREVKRDDKRFERPASYRFELPVFGIPGGENQPKKR